MTEAELSFTFLTQGGQSAVDVANQVADFIGAANHTLELALYDCRLSEPLKAIVTAALRERSAAGVGIRIAYDADKPEVPAVDRGADPAESGTGVYIASLGYPYRRIGGMKLMHSKYIVRDAGFPNAAVWTGSTNFTDDSWTLQENNIVRLYAPEVALDYARDFAQLWDSGQLDGTGSFDTSAYTYNIDGEQTNVRAIFSPGRGHDIDTEVACLVGSAGHRVRLCSMLLNSGTLLDAVLTLLQRGVVTVDGIYDQTQMEGVFGQWELVPSNHWKIPAVQEIVQQARLVGKRSRPYHPETPHDFMHNKVILVDDTVITGSFNFSRSAEQNAENVLIIRSRQVADRYSSYIDTLVRKYGA